MRFIRLLFLCIVLSLPGWCQPAATTPVAPAQDNLPYMTVRSDKGQHLLSWNNQYDGVRNIAVQRSTDSVRNFKTIGMLNAPKKGKGQYTDEHPVVGNNFYRLSIEFGGDLEWFSNTYKLYLDSASMAKWAEERLKAMQAAQAAKEAEERLREAARQAAKEAEKPVEKIPVPAPAPAPVARNTPAKQPELARVDTPVIPKEPEKPAPFTFTPSSKIYTNPYTGHVNINLDDAQSHRYSIRFFDPSKNEVLKVSRVSKPFLVLDKNNFNSRGIFSFQLFDGTTLVESGYVSIY